MAKISLNIPSDLNNIIREYAKNNSLTLTNACIDLFKKGLEEKIENPEALNDLGAKIKELEEKNKELEAKKAELKILLDEEKKLRIDDLKGSIEESNQINKQMLDLMRADKILAIQSKGKAEEEKKEGFFKAFFRKILPNKKQDENKDVVDEQ